MEMEVQRTANQGKDLEKNGKSIYQISLEKVENDNRSEKGSEGLSNIQAMDKKPTP